MFFFYIEFEHFLLFVWSPNVPPLPLSFTFFRDIFEKKNEIDFVRKQFVFDFDIEISESSCQCFYSDLSVS